VWLLDFCASLGMPLSRKSSVRRVDVVLEKSVDAAFQNGEKLYWVTLGVLGLQRALRISGPLLRGTWGAIRGWRALMPSRPRVPITRYCLEGIVLACLGMGMQEVGWRRRQWWAVGLASWLGFCGLLRPGEVAALRVGDLSFDVAAGDEDDPWSGATFEEPEDQKGLADAICSSQGGGFGCVATVVGQGGSVWPEALPGPETPMGVPFQGGGGASGPRRVRMHAGESTGRRCDCTFP
jgi:hypothetical protein